MNELPLHGVDDSESGSSRDPLQPQRCAKLLAALAAPERLQIVRFLRDGPRNVGDIADMLGIPLVNASHHLNVLKSAGLIMGTKRGRFVHYSIVPGVLQPADSEVHLDHVNLGCCRLELPPQDTNKPD